jgi:hypothetical protein
MILLHVPELPEPYPDPVQFQDGNDPTGVHAEPKNHRTPGNEAARARARKANAAIQLRLAGATWEEIAISLGYPTPRQALVATEKALEKQLDTDIDRDKLRRLANARLERLLRSVWTKAIDPEHPDHLIAVTKAKELIDRHAKLFGLDAPTEVVVHTPTQQELEQWVSKVVLAINPPIEEYDILEGEIIDEEAG